MAVIKYSRGRDKFDTPPEQRTAESEDAFIEQILGDIASSKYQQYFCAPMRKGKHPKAPENKKFQGEEGWRLSALADNWRVARFDCDNFDSPKTFQALMRYLIKFKGFCYTTFNHTAEAPRCRFVILLDKEVDRADGVRVCQSIAAEIDAALAGMGEIVGGWQPTVGWDESVYNAECQCYTPIAGAIRKLTKSGAPVTDAQVFRFDGQLAGVDHYLAQCPAQITRSREQNTQCSEGGDFSELEKWCDVDGHTLADLRSALFSPRMLEISAGSRKPWQQVIAALGSLKNSPHEDEAWALALEWSEAGGAAFCHEHFEETWQTSRADMTSYKAIFSTAAEGGQWINPATIRPYLQLEKTGFYMTEKGLMLNIEAGASKARMIVARHVCAPFSILGLARDTYGNGWGYLLEWADPDKTIRRYVVPNALLHSQGGELPKLLTDMGLHIQTGQVKSLATYINNYQTYIRVLSTESTGWHGDVFVLPDSTMGESNEQVVFQSPIRVDCHLATAGSLDEWKQHVAALCAGNSRLVFSLSMVLAAPLIQWFGMGGGVFNLLGDSSKGKSIAQYAAVSVWGAPGFKRSWRATTNGLEGVAVAHNDLPLILDELKEAVPAEVGKAAYMLANGQGKQRANIYGAARPVARWNTLVLSSSEIPFDGYLQHAGEAVHAGQRARFIDIPALVNDTTGLFDTLHGADPSPANAQQFADKLKKNAANYYGVAGLRWLAVLTSGNRAELMALLREKMDAFTAEYAPHNAEGQLLRVLERFALCAAAGELATEKCLTGWESGEGMSGVGACFNAWLGERGTARDMEVVEALDAVRSYLDAYGQSRFMGYAGEKLNSCDGHRVEEPFADIQPANGALPPLETGNEMQVAYWLFPEALSRIAPHCHKKTIVKALTERGALWWGFDGGPDEVPNPRRCSPINNARRRFYVITRELWDD
ncbi:DUF927 domain-containing protein [Sodalis endosymbiont of Spalangia cameroni]|uniref:DUF927 domain-containing protein n=1 Tax=Sodalis praecaptivus TaxID=1239307 RepID=UPI0031F9DC36